MPFVLDAFTAACWAFRDEDHELAAAARAEQAPVIGEAP